MKTQCEKIVDYMNEFGSITQLEAYTDISCFRLASRIADLKKKGYNIRKDMITVKNRYDEPVKVARYALAEAENATY